MKTKHFIVAVFVLLLSSCNKPEYPIENASSYSHIFMPLANNGLNEKSMPIKDSWEAIDLGVGYGGVEENKSNLEVSLSIDESAVDDYNQQNGTQYELAPEGSYRLKEDKVNIKSGRSGSNTTQLEVNPFLLQGTRSYLIPVSISKNSGNLPVVEGAGVTYFLVSGFYDENPFPPISKSSWKVIEVSSEDKDAIGGLGSFCIDDDPKTCWLSQYRRFPDGTRPVHPHFVVVDMNQENQIHGLKIAGRVTNPGQSSQDYLFPTNVFVETSEDNVTWSPAGIFSLLTSPALAPVGILYFEKAPKCRYFKVTVLKSQGNGDTTAISEVNAF